MINYIKIKNFATIKDTEVQFNNGMNAITGETGSGKSVVVEAMSLALGARADSTFVRTGEDKAIIQMQADLDENEYVITREISSSGKNLCKIDDRIVSLSELYSLCEKLADIHGQYDNQYLLKPENHIGLVDIYDRDAIKPAKERVENYYDEYVHVSKALADLEAKYQEKEARKEMLLYSMKEIQDANLFSENEDEQIKEQIGEMKRYEDISSAYERTYDIAYSADDSVYSGFNRVLESIRSASEISKEAAAFEDELTDMYYRFEDICGELSRAKDRTPYSQDEMDQLIERLDLIEDLKRKYGDSITAVMLKCEEIQKELDMISNATNDIESMELEKRRIEELLKDATERLSGLRKQAASHLEGNIADVLQKLNFNDVELDIHFEKLPSYTANGNDKVEFLISPNRGEAMKPLAKIASGGEMSRIMLAFKKVFADYDNIPTLIFDEIDSGISGETASVVGKVLGEIAENRQLIVITHLPQIASLANHNYKIEKTSDDEKTYTTIKELSPQEKISEIARLLSGLDVSDITLESAREMISKSV